MNKGWFRSKKELDEDQKAFIKLPPHGRHSLVGPPGSGKTNLLLLRAEFLAGTGEKNVLIVTYTKALADFIRTGIGAAGLISPQQIRTYHSWATDHIFQYLGHRAIPKGADFDEQARIDILEMVREANTKLPTPKLYSAIFVDEAQDLTVDEL
uniref:UvrD-helicase domain-containing protein n=1 Tax=Chromobacterium subtsugae TaxID=251747 RepID=UPI00064121DE